MGETLLCVCVWEDELNVIKQQGLLTKASYTSTMPENPTTSHFYCLLNRILKIIHNRCVHY